MTTQPSYHASIADAESKLSDLRAKLRLAKDPTVRTTLRRAIESSLLLLDGLALLHGMTATLEFADLHS